MVDHLVPSQQSDHISTNTPYHALHQPHGHLQRNPQVAGDDQQDVHQEGMLRPVGNVVMQGEMEYPRGIGAPNHNVAVAHYYPYPYMHVHRDVVAEAAPARALHITPEVQENYDGRFGYDAQFPVADPPDAFPGVQLHPAAPANMPPANRLRNLASHYLNNPDTHVNILRIEPRPSGRFEVLIVLELADIF
ncbi:hypothetical protein EDB83DRAFT_155158 [Lactarius deliciosus]|nr:hypothetical protein EDB83DRAFT_155158 [Lactarius deliciosus]